MIMRSLWAKARRPTLPRNPACALTPVLHAEHGIDLGIDVMLDFLVAIGRVHPEYDWMIFAPPGVHGIEDVHVVDAPADDDQ